MPKLLPLALSVAISLLAPAVFAQTTPSSPPVAPVRPVTDTYFGTTVTDPYRWMENLQDPEVKTWFKGQANYSCAVLDAIPGRAALLARIQALDSATTAVSDVQTAGNDYFYRQRAPTDNNAKLCIREGLAGPERVLIDPQTLTKNGVHYSIDYYTPSPDGKYVAYGLSPGGSEASTLHVLDTATGQENGEGIDRTDYAEINWRPDGKSFFYSRLQKLGANDPDTGKYQKSRVYLHVLGNDPERDTPVFGYGLSPQASFLVDDAPEVIVIPGCPYAFGIVQRGVQNENAVYIAPLNTLTAPNVPWKLLADYSEDVVAVDGDSGSVIGIATHGDALFLLTHQGASHYKVIRTSLSHPDLPHAITVLPESSQVIRAIGQAQDALYVDTLDGGLSRIFRLAYGSKTVQPVVLPFDGSAYVITNPAKSGALVGLNSWTKSPRLYAYDPRTKQLDDTHLRPPSPIDFSQIESVEVKAKSADGTLVPLSIIYKKGMAMDGSHPALLDGYGAYGDSSTPYFNPVSLAWLERGGILAEAHVRGGGEYGDDWHLAGQKLTKHHTWEDFIACGQYLIDQGYTSPAHLAGEGTSAGGITIGRAITSRPDLFGAALIRVGVSNPLRSEFSPNGPPNVPEFGTVKDPDGFKALYAMDSYQHVVDGVKYPAILVETGINDPRVSSWEPAKMAARLQAATASGKPVILRVDYDAGHGMGSTKSQRDEILADEYVFLFWQLGDPDFQPTK